MVRKLSFTCNNCTSLLVWFHVDNMSSAHVYLRMAKGMEWDKLPESLLIDAAQITKANSIEGMHTMNIRQIL